MYYCLNNLKKTLYPVHKECMLVAFELFCYAVPVYQLLLARFGKLKDQSPFRSTASVRNDDYLPPDKLAVFLSFSFFLFFVVPSFLT